MIKVKYSEGRKSSNYLYDKSENNFQSITYHKTIKLRFDSRIKIQL